MKSFMVKGTIFLCENCNRLFGATMVRVKSLRVENDWNICCPGHGLTKIDVTR
jgi:hypothetical protein